MGRMEAMKSTEDSIHGLVEPLLRGRGLELVDMELARKGAKLWVRLFVDREQGGITAEELGRVNQDLGRLLDVEEPVAESYLLEVSSPGLNRRIRKVKDFKSRVGERVTMAIKSPVEGKKRIKGTIAKADEDGVTVEIDGEKIAVPHSNIVRANLEYRFDESNNKHPKKSTRH